MMMTEAWPHKWFGFWREMAGYEECPSIQTFIDRNAPTPDQRVLDYLQNGKPFLAVSALAYPHAVTGDLRSGSLSFLTDGVWVWPSDLGEYVQQYAVQLPKEFMLHMEHSEYLLPELGEVDNSALEMP